MASAPLEAGRSQPVHYRDLSMHDIERLAEEALAHPDGEVRSQALVSLRPLSHFQQWEGLCSFFRATTSPYALMVLCKATLYIIKNEVGPSERNAMQVFLLSWCADAQSNGCPAFVVRQALVVASHAAFLNFRSNVLSSATITAPGGDADEEEQRQRALLGVGFVNETRQHLNQDLRLVVVFSSEVVLRFADESRGGGLRIVYDLFANEVRPNLFQIALEAMVTSMATMSGGGGGAGAASQQSGDSTNSIDGSSAAPVGQRTVEEATQMFDEAAELATQCLEAPSPESSRSLISRMASEDVVTLSPLQEWLPLLSNAVEVAEDRVSKAISAIDAGDELAHDEAQPALRLVGAVSQVSFDGVPEVQSIVDRIVRFAGRCLTASTSSDVFALHATTILTNLLERQPLETDASLAANDGLLVQMLCHWCDKSTQFWRDHSDDVRAGVLNVISLTLGQGQIGTAGSGLRGLVPLSNFFDAAQTPGDRSGADSDGNADIDSLIVPPLALKASYGQAITTPTRPPGGMRVTPSSLGRNAMLGGAGGAISRYPSGRSRTPKLCFGGESLPDSSVGGDDAAPWSDTGYLPGSERGTRVQLPTLRRGRPRGDAMPSAGTLFYDQLISAVKSYLDAALYRCHLDEATDDVHNADALEAVSESQLKPLARILVQCGLDLGPYVAQVFDTAVQQHELVTRMRHGGSLSDAETEVVLDLAMGADPTELDENSFVLIAARICLSRISVLLSVVGLMLFNRGTFSFSMDDSLDDMALLGRAIKFTRTFTAEDLSDMLQCMDLTGAAAGIQSKADTSAHGRTGSETLHVGVLRSLLYLCGAVATSGYAEQPGFVSCVSEVLTFVLSRHSLHAPVLAADCSAVLMLLTSEEHTSNAFLKGEGVMALLEGHSEDSIHITSRAQGGVTAAAASDTILHHRKHLLRALAHAIDARLRLGYDLVKPDVFYRFLDSLDLADPADVTAAGGSHEAHFTVFMSDVRGVVGALDVQPLLRSTLQWILNLRDRVDAYVRGNPRLVGVMLKTWAKVARRCRAILSDEGVGVLQLEFGRYVFESIGRVLELTPGALQVQHMKQVALLLEATLRGTWCNIAVMFYYEDTTVATVLFHALKKLVQADPGDVVSLKGKEAFFDSIVAAFGVKEATVVLRRSEEYCELCVELGRFLARCLRLHVSISLLRALGVMFTDDSVVLMDESSVGLVVEELTVLLSTSSVPPEWTPIVCAILQRCFNAAPGPSEARFERLLAQAAAYHRVRIRCLLTMLRSQPDNLAVQFSKTFATVGKTQHISAW